MNSLLPFRGYEPEFLLYWGNFAYSDSSGQRFDVIRPSRPDKPEYAPATVMRIEPPNRHGVTNIKYSPRLAEQPSKESIPGFY